jgi:hypothetical protein
MLAIEASIRRKPRREPEVQDSGQRIQELYKPARKPVLMTGSLEPRTSMQKTLLASSKTIMQVG